MVGFYNTGALIITYIILGVPYYNYGIMGAYYILSIKALIVRVMGSQVNSLYMYVVLYV